MSQVATVRLVKDAMPNIIPLLQLMIVDGDEYVMKKMHGTMEQEQKYIIVCEKK